MARHFWSLSVTDMCEIAANSVRQSGFPEELKKVWHGERCGEYVDEK
jgi:adenosine deaminase